jgi:hypothetical protein
VEGRREYDRDGDALMAFELVGVEDNVMGSAGDVKCTYDGGGGFIINEDLILRKSIRTE